MPRYLWQEPQSSIVKADVKQNSSHRYALLEPRAGIDSATLAALPHRLQRHGLIVTPEADANHKPILRVRGFQTDAALLTLLQQEGLTASTAPQIESLADDKAPKGKALSAMQLAGAFYLVADAMPIASGIVRQTPAEVAQGAMWAVTSVALLLFGQKNPEVQMGNMYRRMKDFMAQEGLDIAEDPKLALQQLQRDAGYWNSMINFLYDHPVLFNNTLQGYGGIKQVGAGRAQGNPFKSAAGAAVAAGQWGGMLVPEDKYAGLSPEDKAEMLRKKANGEEPEYVSKTSLISDPFSKVQERPLILTAIGPIIGNLLTTASALFHDRHEVNKFFNFASTKFDFNPATLLRDASRNTADLLEAAGVSAEALAQDKQKPLWERQHVQLEKMVNTHIGWKFTMGSPIFNIIANTLYGMSSKEERSVNLDKTGHIDELLGVAASIYAHVPEAQRGEKLTRFAGFLRSQPDVNISETEIRTRLESKIEALEKSGWTVQTTGAKPAKATPTSHVAANENHAAPKGHSKASQLKSEAANENAEPTERGWADKVAHENSAPSQAVSF